MNRHRTAVLLALMAALLFSVPSFAGENDLEKAIQSFVKSNKIDADAMGVVLYSVRDGAVLFNHNGDIPLTLASNSKLFTTATAFLKLGPDAQLTTVVGYDGEISEQGILEGNLVVVGGGDPNISGRFHDDDPTAIFRGWAEKVREAGINRIDGNILLDDTIFDAVYTHPSWEEYDLSEWWTAPVCGLSLNDNCVDIVVKGGAKAGEKPAISLQPPTGVVKIVNKAEVIGKKGVSAIGFKRSEDGTIAVSGKISAKASTSFSVAVADPLLYFGTVLKETLGREKIAVGGAVCRVRGYKREQMKEIDRFRSGLMETIAVANRNSQNFYAESLFKLLGHNFKGAGTFENGSAVVKETMAEIGIGEIEFEDGSGLSKKNKASPRQIVDLLKYVREHKAGKEFIATLAVSGANVGTLRNRMREKSLVGKVRAKTGYVSGAVALSGYLETDHGDVVIFSILMNGSKNSIGRAHQFQEDVLKLLVKR